MVTPEQIASAEAQIVEESKRIEFYLTEYSVELLAAKMHSKEFVIPPYQRDDTWEPARKSRFIESLLMGLPIPFLFFWESPETGKLESNSSGVPVDSAGQVSPNRLTYGG